MAKDTVQAVREAETAAAALIKDAEEQKKAILADAAKTAAVPVLSLTRWQVC